MGSYLLWAYNFIFSLLMVKSEPILLESYFKYHILIIFFQPVIYSIYSVMILDSGHEFPDRHMIQNNQLALYTQLYCHAAMHGRFGEIIAFLTHNIFDI